MTKLHRSELLTKEKRSTKVCSLFVKFKGKGLTICLEHSLIQLNPAEEYNWHQLSLIKESLSYALYQLKPTSQKGQE